MLSSLPGPDDCPDGDQEADVMSMTDRLDTVITGSTTRPLMSTDNLDTKLWQLLRHLSCIYPPADLNVSPKL